MARRRAARIRLIVLVVLLAGSLGWFLLSGPRDRVARGGALLEEGDVARALEEFKRANVRNPDDLRVWHGLADTHFARKDYAKASEWYQRILAREPGEGRSFLRAVDSLILFAELEASRHGEDREPDLAQAAALAATFEPRFPNRPEAPLADAMIAAGGYRFRARWTRNQWRTSFAPGQEGHFSWMVSRALESADPEAALKKARTELFRDLRIPTDHPAYDQARELREARLRVHALARKALDRDAAFVPARFFLARFSYEHEDHAEVLEALKPLTDPGTTLLIDHNDQREALWLRARAERELKDRTAALETLSRLRKLLLDPKGVADQEIATYATLSTCNLYVELADVAALHREADLILKRDRRSAWGFYYRGMAHYLAQEYQKALNPLSEATSFIRDHEVSMFALADCLVHVGKGEQGLKFYRKLKTLFPLAVRPYVEMARVYEDRGWHAEALQEINQATRLDPSNPVLVAARRRMEERERNPLSLRIDTLEEADQAVAQHPKDAYAHLRRADLLHRAKRSEEAVTELAGLRSSHPNYVYGWLLSGLVHLDLGRPAEALEHYRQALALSENSGLAAIGAGRAHLALGQEGDAFHMCARGLQVEPLDREGNLLMAGIMFRGGKLEHASINVHRLLKDVNPKDVEARALEVQILIASDEHDEAARAIDALLAESPESPRWLTLQGRSRLRAGDLAGAVESFDQALALAPTSTDALVGRADALARRDGPAAGLEVLDPYLKDAPDDPAARLLRGQLRFALGRLPGAREDLELAAKGPGWQASSLLTCIDFLRGELPSAVANVWAVLTRLPYAPSTMQERANVNRQLFDLQVTLGQYPDALQTLIGQAEWDAGFDRRRGRAHLALQRNDPAAAVALAEAIRRDRPKDAAATLTLALAHARLHRWSEVEPLVLEALPALATPTLPAPFEAWPDVAPDALLAVAEARLILGRADAAGLLLRAARPWMGDDLRLLLLLARAEAADGAQGDSLKTLLTPPAAGKPATALELGLLQLTDEIADGNPHLGEVFRDHPPEGVDEVALEAAWLVRAGEPVQAAARLAALPDAREWILDALRGESLPTSRKAATSLGARALTESGRGAPAEAVTTLLLAAALSASPGRRPEVERLLAGLPGPLETSPLARAVRASIRARTGGGPAAVEREIGTTPHPLLDLELGLACLEAGRPEDATGALERARESAPHDPGVLAALADAWLGAGAPEKALAAVRAPADPERRAALLEREGRAHRALGDGEAAERSWSAAAERSDCPVPVFLALGELLEEQERFADALALLERAPPEAASRPLRRLRARLLERTSQTGAATAVWKELFTLAPHEPQVSAELGRLLSTGVRPGPAMESYQRAWFLDPVGQVQSLRAMAAIEEREFNTKDALKYLERARPLAKEDPTFHEAVARVQARLKHFDAAAEAMRLACELAPGVALYHNLRAVYLKEEGHKEAALEEYRKALELEQDAGVRRDLELEILRLTR